MKLPKQVQLGGVVWKVEESYLAGNLGVCRNDRGTIYVDNTLPGAVKNQTFCHELVHAILFSMGKPADQHDEIFVDGFATFLHQYLEQHGK